MRLELNQVSCGHSAAAPVLQNVDLALESGEVCCILGPNGVGKTTLLRTMLHLLPPLSGRISIDGASTRGWKPKKLSQYLAYVAQSHTVTFPYTVREVALMGRLGRVGALGQPSRTDYEIAEQSLEDVGLREKRDVPYAALSGGERQLLLIARALAQQPKLLLMDEPTASLDYSNMVMVIQLIRRLADRGLGVAFTTHMPDQAFMARANTALLRRGQPMLFGTADEVITEKNLFETYQTQIQILEVIGADDAPLKVVVPRLREHG